MARRPVRPIIRPDVSETALPGSGTIKQSQVKAEFNRGNNLRAYLGVSAGVPSSGSLKLTDFYGASSSVFDKSKNPAVYGVASNGYGPGQTGSASGNASSYAMSAQTGSAGATYSLCTTIPLTANKTYWIDYDITLSGTDKGTNISFVDNKYAQSGFPSGMQVGSDTNMKWMLMQTAYWNGGGNYYTDNDGNFVWKSNINNYRASARFQYTVDQYGVKGCGLALSQGSNANNNMERGSVTIHKFVIEEA